MSEYEVGDTVYADFSRFGGVDVRAGTVHKITPTGQVCISFGGAEEYTRFKDGWEIGGNSWDKINLIIKNQYDRLKLIQDFRKGRAKIAGITRAIDAHKTSAEIIETLERALSVARNMRGQDNDSV